MGVSIILIIQYTDISFANISTHCSSCVAVTQYAAIASTQCGLSKISTASTRSKEH